MNLGELIDQLKQYNPDTKVRLGFGDPTPSSEGYGDLAFKLVKATTIGAMLRHAECAKGRTFKAGNGVNYIANNYTGVWLAPFGCEEESIAHTLLQYMANDFDGE